MALVADLHLTGQPTRTWAPMIGADLGMVEDPHDETNLAILFPPLHLPVAQERL